MHYGTSARDDEAAVVPLRGRATSEIAVAPVDLDDLNSPHTMAVLSIPPGSTVLDIGCGFGVVAKALADRGCEVWGVELDPRRASAARNYCVEVREADVEHIRPSSAFPGVAFDAVLLLDVLEHLRDPEATLADAATVLAPGGSLLLSVPNVTHGALRLELLNGRFRYRSTGLLDRGHLRFFDAKGVDELIRQANLRAETRLRVIRRLDQTEFDVDLESVPSTLRAMLENDLDALTYQFFVIVKPERKPRAVSDGITLVERQRARMEELAAGVEQGAAYARHLEEELAAKNARLLEIEAAVANAERELSARDERAREIETAAAQAMGELAAKDARLAEMAQTVADWTRNFEDTDSYARHLEGELRKRSGDIAIRDDEMSVLRTHIERAERTIATRDSEIAERDTLLGQLSHAVDEAKRSIDDREALLRASDGHVAHYTQLACHLSWVLQHPRHRLADKTAHALKRSLPRLYQLLRTLVVPATDDQPAPSGSPPNRGAH